jgi:hypothetical protein
MKRKQPDPDMERLKRLARYYVVVIRDKNTCQKCGHTIQTHKIEWCHVKNRNAPSLVCVPWNSLALCTGHHFWFDAHKGSIGRPAEALAWWMEKFPDRAVSLQSWECESRHRKFDLELERMYLEERIAAAGGNLADALRRKPRP